MSFTDGGIEQQVKAFCAQIGADPLLVQGAGGTFLGRTGIRSGSRVLARGLPMLR